MTDLTEAALEAMLIDIWKGKFDSEEPICIKPTKLWIDGVEYNLKPDDDLFQIALFIVGEYL